MTTSTVIVDDQAAQAQAVPVEVEPGVVHVTVPGPFGTRIYVGPSPPNDNAALWLDTSQF